MTTWKLALTLAAVALAGTALAADPMPRLPVALQLHQTGDSPGVVTFNHDMHVDTAKPSCLSCHPESFSILGRSVTTSKRTPITHKAMEKGGACGACHGKTAFNFDDCTMCHKM
jgi:c(7)-type cytochrome triheme protein